jgi:hypothetical protein
MSTSVTTPRISPDVPTRSRAWWLVGRTAGIAALIATATVIAACGSSTSGSGTVQGSPVPATSGATSGGNQGSGNQGSGGQGAGNGGANGAVNRPGASGKIAAVQSGSFQVQDTSSQTRVPDVACRANSPRPPWRSRPR